MTGACCHYAAGNNGTRLVMAGANGLPAVKNSVTLKINHNELNRALLEKNSVSAAWGMWMPIFR